MIRTARAGEHVAVSEVVHAAYRHYIARIGKPPGPMLDDYAQRVADDQVWVLEEAGLIVGILVLEETPSGFLLDNVAVLPDRQGKGYGRNLDGAEHVYSRCDGVVTATGRLRKTA